MTLTAARPSSSINSLRMRNARSRRSLKRGISLIIFFKASAETSYVTQSVFAVTLSADGLPASKSTSPVKCLARFELSGGSELGKSCDLFLIELRTSGLDFRKCGRVKVQLAHCYFY